MLFRSDVLALLHMVGFHAALELAGADAHESDAVPVGLVHVGLDLEDESRELVTAWIHGLAGQAVHTGQRGGGEPQEVLQEGLHTEVGQGRTEEHGAELAAQHLVQIKFLGGTVQQLDLIGELEALQEKGLSVAYAARGEGIYEQKSVRPKCSIRSKQQSLNASDDMF